MKTQPVANPFALMMDPQAVLQAMERSERLQHLQRRICRPLDKPLIPRNGAESADFDHQIDDESDTQLGDFSTSVLG
jgi:hypothetical protein